MKTLLVAFASGALFGGGLVLSGMTDPRRIQAFLALTDAWDPSLLLVMGAAVAVHALVLRLDARRAAPAASTPPSGKIDKRLILGAGIFGVGWGLTGYCPGPAVVSAGAVQLPAIIFIIAMIAGMALYHLLWARLQSGSSSSSETGLPPNRASTIIDI